MVFLVVAVGMVLKIVVRCLLNYLNGMAMKNPLGYYCTTEVSRVATKVGFHNFAKYEISRNTLLISRNFAKFIGTNFAKFRQGI
jgi:hypothetical protein